MKKTLLTMLLSLSIFSVVFAQATDLFFSAYIEGSSNNKALAIYNGTGATVDLSNYLIVQSTNGKGWQYYHEFPAGAKLENGHVWTMVSNQVDSALFDTTMANEVLAYPDLVYFNGDDARGLLKINGTDTTLIDVIGIPDVDPGSGWDVAGVSTATKDHSLYRKPSVTGGDTSWAKSAGTDSASSEWWVFPQNDFFLLSRHIITMEMARGMVDDTVTVAGITISPNFQTSNRSYYIMDETAGMATFSYGMGSPALKMGDVVVIDGKISDYYGLIEINSLSDTNVVVVDSNQVLPPPQEITIAEYNADPESYEGELVSFKNLDLASGTWSTSGSSSLKLTDGTDTVAVYLDSDMGLFNSPEPKWPVDLVGVASQYNRYSTPGTQILPRTMDDFMPATPLPVELTSFTANVTEGLVELTWATATEKNNSGFEIQRSLDGKNFAKIGFVQGQGNSVKTSMYSFTDQPGGASEYYYRLKQIDLNGSFTYSNVIQTNVTAPNKFSLEQNYPNPFNPTTSITFNLKVDSKVTLKVFNILGQEVATLLNSNIQSGVHVVNFNASQLTSGVYFYRLKANGIDGSVYNAVKKMILNK